jgi:predicted transcriptional regulator
MDELFTLSTISEIAELWGKHPLTVRRALNAKKNPLRARQSGRVILISVESVIKRWGDPHRCFDKSTLI